MIEGERRSTRPAPGPRIACRLSPRTRCAIDSCRCEMGISVYEQMLGTRYDMRAPSPALALRSHGFSAIRSQAFFSSNIDGCRPFMYEETLDPINFVAKEPSRPASQAAPGSLLLTCSIPACQAYSQTFQICQRRSKIVAVAAQVSTDHCRGVPLH
jgi:hypothetical protein